MASPLQIRRPAFRAVLIVSDFECSPEAITSRLGVSPSDIVQTGKPTSLGYIGKTNRWVLKTPETASRGLDDLVSGLLQQLEVCWQELIAICASAHVQLLCEVWFEGDPTELTFDMGFSKDTVKRLAELGALIGFDVYPGK